MRVQAGQHPLRPVERRAVGVAGEDPVRPAAPGCDHGQLVPAGQLVQALPVQRAVLDPGAALGQQLQPAGQLEPLVDRLGGLVERHGELQRPHGRRRRQHGLDRGDRRRPVGPEVQPGRRLDPQRRAEHRLGGQHPPAAHLLRGALGDQRHLVPVRLQPERSCRPAWPAPTTAIRRNVASRCSADGSSRRTVAQRTGRGHRSGHRCGQRCGRLTGRRAGRAERAGRRAQPRRWAVSTRTTSSVRSAR